MNIDYFKNLNLKCTYCNNIGSINLYNSRPNDIYQWVCENKGCIRCADYTVFLRVAFFKNSTIIESIEFFIHQANEQYYGFEYYNADDMLNNDHQILYIDEQKMLKLLEEYSKTSDIKLIRQKYYDLILFK